jgi:hypothetical protein
MKELYKNCQSCGMPLKKNQVWVAQMPMAVKA